MADTAERGPAEVWPLASFLAEEMEARGWTSIDVAARMGGATVDEITLNALVVDFILAIQEDNCVISDDVFEGLARAFDVSAEYFKSLDAMWRKWPDRREPFEPDEKLFSCSPPQRH